MKVLYDHLSIAVSRMTTRKYSTSFSLGIYFIDPRLRDAIYSIYGFVRIADEIVDSFEGYDKRSLLYQFRIDTLKAIKSRISVNPILNSFQDTVYKFGISLELIEQFLHSMEMDLNKNTYEDDQYRQYIFGSAEVVGLMCLHVFTEGDPQKYDQLKPFAMRLGSAFQKVNFLRDMRADYQVLGRIYFPGIRIENFNCIEKLQIESDIERDFKAALQGIKKLPFSSRRGVYIAYTYYNSLFEKIRRLPPKKILSSRIRINNYKKLQLMLAGWLQSSLRLI
jgi:phytoene/squalene synthetase